MDFDLSKPQKLLKQSARDLLARESKPERVRAAMATDTAFDEALWQAIADQGWTGLILPEEHGGLDLGIVELAAVAEETGRVCMAGPFLSTTFAAAVIAAVGSAEQQALYLPRFAAGEMRGTVAILEEAADWNLEALRMSAAGSGSASVLSGEKHFVYDAAIADVILVVARAGTGLVVLPVTRDQRGVTIRHTASMDATRKVSIVSFDRVEVASSQAMPCSSEALSYAISVATVALCAEMVGGMQWVLDTTVDYAKSRQQFGKAIGSFQAVQHQCADMLLLTESARSAAYYAAWALSHRDPAAAMAVAIAKSYCSDAAREVGNRGVQVHGGIGFTWEHDLQLYYKRSKAAEVLFGDATFHRERIARLILDQPANEAFTQQSLAAAVAD